LKPLLVAALLVLSLLAAPLAAQAQQAGKLPHIGAFSPFAPSEKSHCLPGLRRGLTTLGYREGATHLLTVRWPEAETGSFRQAASELVKDRVDVIVLFAGDIGISAVKQATATIPIVMATSAYPVERGIVASLARPGGNITGVATFTHAVIGKRVQLLKEAVPAASRVVVLRTPTPEQIQDYLVSGIDAAAHQVGVTLKVIEVRLAEDLPRAFQTAVRWGGQAVLTTQHPFFHNTRAQIGELALRYRLPSVSGEPGAAAAGTLISYGPDIGASCERSATYVHRILKGAKPADLPIEQPTKFELAINLKTAKALGLTIPQSLLLRADQIIE
jgi:putative ABC transport system substrate-binding protein